ncbi:MAG TPA: hypothetical protein DCS93_03250 [Microscillaceae bacterium]|nr:hypothetical protein [Microscillaceae bacterium]
MQQEYKSSAPQQALPIHPLYIPAHPQYILTQYKLLVSNQYTFYFGLELKTTCNEKISFTLPKLFRLQR